MREPLYRVSFDPQELLREHPPVFRHPHKAKLFEVAYPRGAESIGGDDDGAGGIEVTRWAGHVDEPLAMPRGIATQVWADFYDYEPADEDGQSVEWHVNFADPRLFVAYGSGLFAQDEMQVAEHPLLACVREALLSRGLAAKTSDETGATPVLVKNVERRIEVATNPDAAAGRPMGLYGNRFAAAPIDVVLRATRRIEPPTITHFIAMAAPSGGRGEYTEREIAQVFTTAYTAFAAARGESIRGAGPAGASAGASADSSASADRAAHASSMTAAKTVVHTGFWGCGAFGGNRRLMVALQSLAARAAGVDKLVIYAGDKPGLEEARLALDVADTVAARCGERCTLDTLVGRCAMLGYRWGVSDGN